jgi:hypothetical protein
MISGVVLDEKFKLARITPCIDCRTFTSVIVLPEPGGPHYVSTLMISVSKIILKGEQAFDYFAQLTHQNKRNATR